MTVDQAVEGDLAAVMNVFDGADLAVSAAAVERAIAAGRVLVVRSDADTVLGALLVQQRDGNSDIEAIAVRPGRRGQGFGTALVEAAVDRWAPLFARFDSAVWPFYRFLGFQPVESRATSERMAAVRLTSE